MARLSIWHERNFDRNADFLVNKSLTISGVGIEKDTLFDKTTVSTRLLRQLYEQRKIRFIDGDRGEAPPGRPLTKLNGARR